MKEEVLQQVASAIERKHLLDQGLCQKFSECMNFGLLPLFHV